PSQIQQASQPAEPQGDIVTRAVEGNPALQKIDRGLQQGVAAGFGLTPPDPNHPESMKWSEAIGQTWDNLKKSAQHSFKTLGGHTEDLEIPKDTGLFSGSAPTMTARS